MKTVVIFRTIKLVAFSIVLVAISAFALQPNTGNNTGVKFPYLAAGLTQKQAAAHLLNRFTYGATPEMVDAVASKGLEKWFEEQLKGVAENPVLTEKLKEYPDLNMDLKDVLNKYMKGPKVRNMAIKDGYITEAEIKDMEKKEIYKKLKGYADQKGIVRENLLYEQLYNKKIYSALYSNNQLHEVLTDFWFNHFNVSMTKNQSQQFVPHYELKAIRPNVVSNFQDLVLATAKHPAMLFYLDNVLSQGAEDSVIIKGKLMKKMENGKIAKRKKSSGLNENYAREVMELHTLGVDGGYTQKDVTEAARVLTGWTINPINLGNADNQIEKIISKVGIERLEKTGFVQDGPFLFVPQRHDAGVKNVLGKTYTNTGYNEGVTLLQHLANHESTAKFIAKKIAIRFVNDNPKQSLITAMTKTFLNSKGNIKEVLYTMVTSKEFWDKDAVREKTKSPFEYAISSLRVINADVTAPQQINNWITKMGQQMYHYSAPTGFPDKAQQWINTGSLLNRMNFGLALASKRISGVSFDLAALNNNQEPESAADALPKYAALLLPQRDVTNTVKRLLPIAADVTTADKIEAAVKKQTTVEPVMEMTEVVDNMDTKEKLKKAKKMKTEPIVKNFGDNSMLAQVVGIVIGSPEFQRR